MAKKKKLFPFRFRWFSAPSARQSRPIAPQKDESKSQEQADTTIHIQESPEKVLPQTLTQDIPIADPQQETPSHSLQPEKQISVTNGSSELPKSKSESLTSISSFSTPQPQPQPQPPAQQEKEKMAVTKQEPRPVMSPFKAILKPPEPTQPKISPHVSESIPHIKESPLRTISKSQDQTQSETSSHGSEKSVSQPKVEPHVFESMPPPKESPSKTTPKSQEITQFKTSPHMPEPVPQLKEPPFRSTHESQDLNQPETSAHASESVPRPKTEPNVFESKPQSKESPSKTIPKPHEITQSETSSNVSEPLPHPKESPLKTIPESQDSTHAETSSNLSESMPHPEKSSLVFDSIPQSKESPSKAIPKSQEITKSETPSHVHEPVSQLKDSPSKTSPKTKETQSVISSHDSVQKTNVKESPLKTSPHVFKPMPQQKMSPLKIVPTPEEPIQPKTSPRPKRMSSELHTKASTLGTQTTDSSVMVTKSKRKRQDTQESVKSNLMSASNSNGKDTKIVSPIHLLTKNVSIPFHQEDTSPIGEKTPLKEGIKGDISKFVQKLAMGQPADTMVDNSISSITLAGENKGATMHMGSESTKKEESVHIHQDYGMDSHESSEVATESDREEESHTTLEPNEVGNAYVNSNIQSINNSLMYQGSITEKDPGVQLILPQRPVESIKSDGEDSKG